MPSILPRFAALGALAAGLLAAPLAQAALVTTTVSLSGPAEAPPNASPGTGSGTIALDTTAHRLTLDLSFTGLTAPAIMAHIHCCVVPPGTAPVATAVPALPGFPLNAPFGTYAASLDTRDTATWNPVFVTANGGLAGAESALFAGLSAGQAYFNIHTANFPAGEIRGFAVPVPEPAALGLFAAGLAGLLAARRATGSAARA